MVKIFCSADSSSCCAGEEVGVTFADDLGGALDQVTADRFLADELGVVPGVGGVGNAIGDLEEHLVAADLLELIAADQFVGQRHGVHALTALYSSLIAR